VGHEQRCDKTVINGVRPSKITSRNVNRKNEITIGGDEYSKTREIRELKDT